MVISQLLEKLTEAAELKLSGPEHPEQLLLSRHLDFWVAHRNIVPLAILGNGGGGSSSSSDSTEEICARSIGAGNEQKKEVRDGSP
jgi:hypothetical protein